MNTYLNVVRYVLQTYAAGNVIAETDVPLARYIQPSAKPPKKYAEELVLKKNTVWGRARWVLLKGIFVEDIHASVHRSLQSHCSTHPGPALYDLARSSMSLQALQEVTDVYFETWFGYRRNLRNHRGRSRKLLGRRQLREDPNRYPQEDLFKREKEGNDDFNAEDICALVNNRTLWSFYSFRWELGVLRMAIPTSRTFLSCAK